MTSTRHLSRRLRPHLKPIYHLDQTQQQARERLLKKLGAGAYAMEQTDCDVCGLAPFDIVAEREQYGLPYRVAMCQNCGLLWTTPRMTAEAAVSFYAGEFRELHGGVDGRAVETAFIKKLPFGLDLFQFSRGVIPASGLVVEVGCGTGANLKAFQDQGFDVAGCDYGEPYLQCGTRHGVRGLVLGGVDTLLGKYGGRADLVILSHVLEHFTDIPRELANIRQLISPGGLLLIAVPGLRRLRESGCLGNLLAYFIVSHNYHFSLQSLVNVMARNDFNLVRGNERIVAMFEPSKELPPSAIQSCRDRDLEFLTWIERRWSTWTLPERFLWERRHFGLRRRLGALVEFIRRRREV